MDEVGVKKKEKETYGRLLDLGGLNNGLSDGSRGLDGLDLLNGGRGSSSLGSGHYCGNAK